MMECPSSLPEFKLLIDSNLETSEVYTTTLTEDMDELSETDRNRFQQLLAPDNTEQTPEDSSGNRSSDSGNMYLFIDTDNSEENAGLRSTHTQKYLPETITEFNVTDTDRNSDEIDLTEELDNSVGSFHYACPYANLAEKTDTEADFERHYTVLHDKHVTLDSDAWHKLRCSICTCVTNELDTNLERETYITDESDTNLGRKNCITDDIVTNLERNTLIMNEIDTGLERKIFVTSQNVTDLERKLDEIGTDLEMKTFATDEIDIDLERQSSRKEQNDTNSGRHICFNLHDGAMQADNRLEMIDQDRDSDGATGFHARSIEKITIDVFSKRNSDYVDANTLVNSNNSLVSDTSKEPVNATPQEGFSEKEALVAVLGTLLVIMCIEIYASSNKPLEETDLLEKTDDLGLNLLFQTEEIPSSSREAGRNTSTRSKSARKRKKQQQKLLRRMPMGKRKNRFAEKFEDLRRPVYEDLLTDVDHSLTCPICLEMYYLPCLCQPCGHIFCDPCLRRLTYQGSEGVLCPLCRTVIQCCVPDKEFNDQLMMSHGDIFSVRHSTEKKSKYRHFHLPFTPPTPLSQRLMRHLVTNRNNLPVNEGTLYNVSKLLVGLLTGTCISVLIMLLSHVRGIHTARDVNIMFLSFCTGALVTILFYKVMRL